MNTDNFFKSMGKKRAMSPLLSTILLIGFAIALGGIVMSWGKSGYTVASTLEGCEETSLSLISFGENPGICQVGNRLYFTIQNNGEISLDGIKVDVLGTDGIYSSVITREINVADIIKLDSEYGNGEIEKVIFTPRFTYLEQEKLCPKKGFSIDKVGEC